MKVAVTGATGFIGRYIVRRLIDQGHVCRCWIRSTSDRSGFEGYEEHIEWCEGELTNVRTVGILIEGTDAVVHSALYHPGGGFRRMEGDLDDFVYRNVAGTIQLIERAQQEKIPRFVFISTCAVHEVVLPDRPLDENHPLFPTSHYGAHKAAIEKFVHSYGLGGGYSICALRPTGVYGINHPPQDSKWYGLVKALAQGDTSRLENRGGKEVHASDVAKAVEILLLADNVAGQAYNCYDQYVSELHIAEIVSRLTGQKFNIKEKPGSPKHQIDTSKIRALGMEFGGRPLLEETIEQMLNL